MHTRKRTLTGLVAAVTVSTGLFAAGISPVDAALDVARTRPDVLIGADDDNVENLAIQPLGTKSKQHLDNTDLLFAKVEGDTLIGVKGDDVLVGDRRDDVFIGGPEFFVGPNSDVILGGGGKDINIWQPGDGSDAYVGGAGFDVQIFAPLVLSEESGGTLPQLFPLGRREIPKVNTTDAVGRFTCIIDPAPADSGYDYLARFLVNGGIAVTVRLADVEMVICPGPDDETINRAVLRNGETVLREVPKSVHGDGLLGAILDA